jgi:hypothetical protein
MLVSRISPAPIRAIRSHHDRLVAERVGCAPHQLGIGDRRRVDPDLVGAREQQPPHVVDRAHAAADGQRQEYAFRGGAHDVQHRLPPVRRRGDVEEADLVGALRVVGGRDRDRIAGVAQLLEAHALLDAAGVDVEAGDHALAQHD